MSLELDSITVMPMTNTWFRQVEMIELIFNGSKFQLKKKKNNQIFDNKN